MFTGEGHMCMHMYVFVWRDRSWLGIFLYCSVPSVLTQDLLLILEHLDSGRLVTSKLQGSSPVLRLHIKTAVAPGFLCRC